MNNLKMFYRNLPRFFACKRHIISNLHEPDYLEGMKSKIPLYDTLNIQLRGYDYPVLENYQKLVHNIAQNLDIDVEDAWAIPAQNLQICTYKPKSEVVNSQFKLNNFERTVQITDVSTLQLSVLLRALETCAPPGVTLNIVHHEDYHEEVRYVPDSQLKALKQELDDMGGPAKKK